MIDASGIMNATASHAQSLGLFERVNQHEPKNAPGKGLTVAVWVQALGPVAVSSGLDATSARLEVSVRIYSSMIAEPQDMIDPALVDATSALMAAYSGDFTLGGRVRNVDLLGHHGTPLSAVAGYLEQDKFTFRVMTITVPLIINDAWEQVA